MRKREKIYSLVIDDEQSLKRLEKFMQKSKLMLEQSEENQKVYLRGFFAGGGTIYTNEYEIILLALESPNAKKIDVCHELLKKFGINSLVHHNPHTEIYSENSTLYIVGF